jgi:hypothetical protein
MSVLFFPHEIKQVLEHIMHDQPTIYEMSDGDEPRKEASQQQVVQVVIGRIADELGIQLGQQPEPQFTGPVVHVELDGKAIAECVSSVNVAQMLKAQREEEHEAKLLLRMAHSNYSNVKSVLKRLARYYGGRARSATKFQHLQDAMRWQAKKDAILKVAENLEITLELGEETNGNEETAAEQTSGKTAAKGTNEEAAGRSDRVE